MKKWRHGKINEERFQHKLLLTPALHYVTYHIGILINISFLQNAPTWITNPMEMMIGDFDLTMTVSITKLEVPLNRLTRGLKNRYNKSPFEEFQFSIVSCPVVMLEAIHVASQRQYWRLQLALFLLWHELLCIFELLSVVVFALLWSKSLNQWCSPLALY